MKTHRLFLVPAVLMAAGLLSNCASPVERRIRKNPDAFARLHEADKSAVMAGKIREGMDKSAVFLAWGPPARVSEGRKSGRNYERWTYVEYDAVLTQSYGPPYGWHGHGGYYDAYDPMYYARPAFDYIPREASYVEFVGDKVTGWGMPKR